MLAAAPSPCPFCFHSPGNLKMELEEIVGALKAVQGFEPE